MMNSKILKGTIILVLFLLSCNQINITNSTMTTGPYSINGNTNLAAASVSGTGTFKDPYILSNQTLDCHTDNLYINNTNAYFVLQGQGTTANVCYVNLYMNNVSHAEIRNEYYFVNVNIIHSENITIENSHISSTNLEETSNYIINNITVGIHQIVNTNNGTINERSHSLSITNSTNIRSNGSYFYELQINNSTNLEFQESIYGGNGLTVQYGTNIIFSSSKGYGTPYTFPITIQESNNVEINNFEGIFEPASIQQDKNVILHNITAYGNIPITDSQNITVENSNISNGDTYSLSAGVISKRSSNIKIMNNKFNGFLFDKNKIGNLITLELTDNIQIVNNLFNFSNTGINLVNVQKCLIERNNLTSIKEGIVLTSSSFNTISNNKIINSTSFAIGLINSTDNTISNNVITDSTTGIYLSNSSNNIFNSNSFINVNTSTLFSTNTIVNTSGSGLPGFDFGVLFITACIIIKRRRTNHN